MENKQFPLHPAQKDVYVDQLLNVESPHYNIGGYIKLDGYLNKEKFYETITTAPKFFDAFKMRFDLKAEEPKGLIDDEFDYLPLSELDFSISENSRQEAINWMQDRFNTPFEIQEHSQLFEHVLIKIGECEHWLLCRYHHLITDGFGFTVWVNYVGKSYKSLVEGDQVDFDYPSYIDEAVKAEAYYNSADYEDDAKYWKEKITEKPPKLLQKKHQQKKNTEKRSSTLILDLTEDQRRLLEVTKLLTKAGLQQLTIAALIVYFGKTTTSTEFLFGIPLHKRGSKRLRSIYGMFSGFSPLKATYLEDYKLLDFLKEITQAQKRDYRHQNYLIGDLSRHLKVNVQDGYLTEVIVNNEPLNFEVDFGKEVTATILRLSNDYQHDPLQLVWREYGSHRPLQMHIHYMNEYFNEEEIKLLAQRFFFILDQFHSNLDNNIGSIDIIPSPEREMLNAFSTATTANYQKDKTLVDLFEEQVKKTPHSKALVFEKQKLSYQELNAKSNHLALNLRSHGVKEDTLVPICMERGAEMIVGILAILKAGGAYVPIDPDYPSERIHYMLEDMKANVILISSSGRINVQLPKDIGVIKLGEDWLENINHTAENLQTFIVAEQLAYVIYTSGSTGKPKGVMIEHGSVVNLIEYQTRAFKISEGERILQFSNYCFDASVEQIFLSLATGSTLILINKEVVADPIALLRLIQAEKVTHLHATPSYLETVPCGKYGNLKRVIAGGETCSVNLATGWGQYVDFFNEYGPTETTVTITEYKYISNSSATVLPIGTAISNSSVYILDKDGQITPIGIPGEMHLGGVQVARGYLNLPELTAEKFINNSFMNEPGAKMYKTGDLCRWLPDGNIEYLGRIDDQVKIRGYRIELGEIESVLLQSGLVSQTVVVAKEDKESNKGLIGYIVSDGLFDKEAVISYLKERLPGYMVPAVWVQIESMPLTSNGKIDRKALPDVDVSELGSKEYVAPGNETEEKLAVIWQELLQVERVGIEDNFFELGGHSLKAIQLTSRLHKLLNLRIELGEIIANPTIKQLSKVLASQKQEVFGAIPNVTSQDHYDLSHAQKRFWILSRFKNGSTAYNGLGSYTIEGNLNVDAFKNAFATLIERHESLRTIFIEFNGEPRQKILPASQLNFRIKEVDIRKAEVQEIIIKDLISRETDFSFDLSNGPLLRGTLVQVKDNQYLFVFNIHHIISDGWSKGIFITEFISVYRSIHSGLPVELPSLSVQYKDYAAWHEQKYKSQGKYWRELFERNIPVLDFPVDYERPKVISYIGAVIKDSINEHLHQKLQKIALQHNMTINNLLFALYGLLVSKYSNQDDDVVIGSLTAGRSHPDIENLIGVFINFLPIRLTPKKELRLSEYLSQSQQSLLQAYSNQDYPFDLMVEDCIKQRDISRNPFFDTMINFQPQNVALEQVKITEDLILKLPDSKEKGLFQSVLDFKLDIEPIGNVLYLNLSYNTMLYSKERMENFLKHYVQLIENVIRGENNKLENYLKDEFENMQVNGDGNISSSSLSPTLPVNICASFVIEPVQEYMEYWSKELDLNLKTNIAPYNQVFQQLLDPKSLLNENKGINILFINIKDWLLNQKDLTPDQQIDALDKQYPELIKAIDFTRNITFVPYMVAIVPLYTPHSFSSKVVKHISTLNQKIELSLKNKTSFYIIDLDAISKLYNVEEYYDSMSDKLGHMPFTQEYYGALGTYLTRKICAFTVPSYKVIALDCDDTLWKGICGEVGPLGVSIDAGFSFLQEFLIQKYDEGFLLALCSKNNEDDVWEVFSQNPKMKLTRNHIAAHRINWKLKTDNLLSISKELNVGIESIIFIDDNEFEVEQIALEHPEMLSLTLPADSKDFSSFFNHIWAFDRFTITEEDQQRNLMYKAEKLRKEEQVHHNSLTEFLKSLNVTVNIRELEEKDLERAVQLSMRTNQFNMNGGIRTYEEISKLLQQKNALNWIIEVKDRFGDYGIVGLLLGTANQKTFVLETFLLSCRVLGRNVEDFILSDLKKYCEHHKLEHISVLFKATSKNKPFSEFLDRSNWEIKNQPSFA